ncbi:MAG: 6-bladed beta-propeller [Pyrinomonadaceae bacterium]
MTVQPNIWSALSKRRDLLLCLIGAIALYAFYISGLSHNPPGSYLDESGGAYNAYLIATTGKSEFGIRFPLYFQFYTENAIEYSNSPHIYLMALMYLFVPPSILAARVMAGTMVFLATILLGILACRISGRRSIGIIVTIIAVATPWLYEASRLILEVFIYPVSLVLFLYCLYRAQEKEKWSIVDNALLGALLGLLTYSYTIGRLLAPMLALGLILFGLNRKAFLNVLKTWIAYAVSLLPLVIFYLSNPDAISKRFKSVTYISASKPLTQNVWEFLQSYFADISPSFLLYTGDPLLRHHVPGMGGILAATFVLAVVGLIVVLISHRSEPWWQFVLYGLVVSVVPGALTMQRYHSLRLIAFPIFLLLITIPAIVWLIGERRSAADESEHRLSFAASPRVLGIGLLGIVLALTIFQSFVFHGRFVEASEGRSYVFDGAYPQVLNKALAGTDRPIFLEDGFWGPAYIHAYWYGTIWGVDPSNFVHLAGKQLPPEGSIVLTSNTTCNSCEIVFKSGSYLLYRYTGRDGVVDLSQPSPNSKIESPPTAVPVLEKLAEAREIKLVAGAPRGIALEKSGDILVTDPGGALVQRLSPTGKLLSTIGAAGSGDGELKDPTGIVVDANGNIYVADGAQKRVVKFDAKGNYIENLAAPEGGFSYPNDLALSGNSEIYIADRGRAMIMRFDLKTGNVREWGSTGARDGEFESLFGIGVSEDRVFAVDTQSDRVQVFHKDGTFASQWPVPQWSKYIWHRPDAVVDTEKQRVFVSSGWSQEILIFDIDGKLLGSLKPQPPVTLNNPSSLILSGTKDQRSLYVLNTGRDVVDTGDPSIVIFDLGSVTTN